VTAVLLWVWLAVVVVALLILGFSVVPLLGRLSGLRRAAVKLRRHQAEAIRLQENAAVLERTLAEVQQRAEPLHAIIAAIAPECCRKLSLRS
jgi:hypothetical protein